MVLTMQRSTKCAEQCSADCREQTAQYSVQAGDELSCTGVQTESETNSYLGKKNLQDDSAMTSNTPRPFQAWFSALYQPCCKFAYVRTWSPDSHQNRRQVGDRPRFGFEEKVGLYCINTAALHVTSTCVCTAKYAASFPICIETPLSAMAK